MEGSQSLLYRSVRALPYGSTFELLHVDKCQLLVVRMQIRSMKCLPPLAFRVPLAGFCLKNIGKHIRSAIESVRTKFLLNSLEPIVFGQPL